MTYLLGLAKSVKSFTLHATSFSTQTGTLIASRNVPSSLSPTSPTALPSNAFLTLNIVNTTASPSVPPLVLWLESNSLRSFALNPDLTGKPGGFKGITYKELVDVGLGEEYGMFVAVQGDGSGKVVKLSAEKEGGVKGIWEFAESVRFVYLFFCLWVFGAYTGDALCCV
jgi:ER membrane protein complex subunit 1